MKITSVETIAVSIARSQPFTSSLGKQRATINAIVEVHTDEGITGIGEASSVWDRLGRGERDNIDGALAELLVNQDPFCINAINALMDERLHHSFPAKAAVEMALFDIAGKALNTPVYNLLGGCVHERIPLSRSLSMGPSDENAAQAEQLAAEGYTTLKMKIGRDSNEDFANLEAIRKVLPGIILRVDANMGWSSAREAVRRIGELEQFDLEFVEQPLPAADLEGMRFVRDHVGVPVMVDESIWRPNAAIACMRAKAADIFNVYVSEAGGLTPASDIFSIAEAAHIPCMIGSMPEFGIGTAAQTHLAFAMRNIGFACDLNGCTYHKDDIILETLPIESGYIYPPTGPGLGISIDRDKLEHYQIA